MWAPFSHHLSVCLFDAAPAGTRHQPSSGHRSVPATQQQDVWWRRSFVTWRLTAGQEAVWDRQTDRQTAVRFTGTGTTPSGARWLAAIAAAAACPRKESLIRYRLPSKRTTQKEIRTRETTDPSYPPHLMIYRLLRSIRSSIVNYCTQVPDVSYNHGAPSLAASGWIESDSQIPTRPSPMPNHEI
ncbi:hypothetical protein LY76DRAFT_100164 [Colletotrichum caudatum]|nr:hypothetical protein LY76DRAFT_100164 [Colletotrichum caudatum]